MVTWEAEESLLPSGPVETKYLWESEAINLAVLKRVSGIHFEQGGEGHSGWLPPGAATPLPTPIRHLTLDLTLEDDGGAGYLLVFAAREDSTFANDYWFDNAADAEAMAVEWFGIEPDLWQPP